MKAFDVKQVVESVPIGATVVVTLSDSDAVKEQYRGIQIAGYWNGVYPDPAFHPSVRSPHDGSHWVAHVVDPRSDDLVWDIHLRAIKTIDVTNKDIRNASNGRLNGA